MDIGLDNSRRIELHCLQVSRHPNKGQAVLLAGRRIHYDAVIWLSVYSKITAKARIGGRRHWFAIGNTIDSAYPVFQRNQANIGGWDAAVDLDSP